MQQVRLAHVRAVPRPQRLDAQRVERLASDRARARGAEPLEDRRGMLRGHVQGDPAARQVPGPHDPQRAGRRGSPSRAPRPRRAAGEPPAALTTASARGPIRATTAVSRTAKRTGAATRWCSSVRCRGGMRSASVSSTTIVSSTSTRSSACTAPFGVRSAARQPWPGRRAATSLLSMPCRNDCRGGPETSSTPRSERSTRPASSRAARYSPAASPYERTTGRPPTSENTAPSAAWAPWSGRLAWDAIPASLTEESHARPCKPGRERLE